MLSRFKNRSSCRRHPLGGAGKRTLAGAGAAWRPRVAERSVWSGKVSDRATNERRAPRASNQRPTFLITCTHPMVTVAGCFSRPIILFSSASRCSSPCGRNFASVARSRMGAVRASSNITGAESGSRDLAGGQHPRRQCVEINDTSAITTTRRKAPLSFQQRLQHAIGRRAWHAAHETGHAIQHAKAYGH